MWYDIIINTDRGNVMSTWLIKVNATKYNILGAAREFGDELPWHFAPDEQIKEGDRVFFYLTSSKESDSKKPYPLIDQMFQRFLFEGEIKEIDCKNPEKDDKYWNDLKYKKQVEAKDLRYASITITEVLYDYKIMSSFVDDRIWKNKKFRKDVYELDSEMVQSIEKWIQTNK